MGNCNCGKRSTPTGYGMNREPAAPSTTNSVPSVGAPDSSRGNARTSPTGQTLPTGSGVSQSFSLRTTDGRVQTYGSRLEAAAARERLGGTLI